MLGEHTKAFFALGEFEPEGCGWNRYRGRRNSFGEGRRGKVLNVFQRSVSVTG
jgi:hypothetical protein